MADLYRRRQLHEVVAERSPSPFGDRNDRSDHSFDIHPDGNVSPY
jgi:hypothetical protein